MPGGMLRYRGRVPGEDPDCAGDPECLKLEGEAEGTVDSRIRAAAGGVDADGGRKEPSLPFTAATASSSPMTAAPFTTSRRTNRPCPPTETALKSPAFPKRISTGSTSPMQSTASFRRVMSHTHKPFRSLRSEACFRTVPGAAESILPITARSSGCRAASSTCHRQSHQRRSS